MTHWVLRVDVNPNASSWAASILSATRSSGGTTSCASVLSSNAQIRDARAYSTVTVFARFRGWSTFSPRRRAIRYASSWSGSTASTACRNAGVRGT